MEYKKEMFNFEDTLPAKIIFHDNQKRQNYNEFIPKHWHNSLEITYIKAGAIDVWNNGINKVYGKDDLVVINSGEIHSITPLYGELELGIAITLILPYDLLKQNYKNIDRVTFKLNDNLGKKKLCSIFEDIFITQEEGIDDFKFLKMKSHVYDILYVLFSHCKDEKKTATSYESQKYLERIRTITKYIKENYKEDITLEWLAQEYGLSKEHLSRNFKVYVGMTFTKYLESIRVYNAHRDLVNTDYSVTDIALYNGFPNVKSFIASFKKIYGDTPQKYRRNRS
ncbi:MAG: helix-turn-helix domain-containing protein [Turicibacter sp.]